MQALAYRRSGACSSPCARRRPAVWGPQHQLRASLVQEPAPQHVQRHQQRDASTSLPAESMHGSSTRNQQLSRRDLLFSSAATLALAAFAQPAAAAETATFAQRFRLDTFVPVKGLRRCTDYNNLFEFQYPSQWVADQGIAKWVADQAEQEHPLDPPSPEEIRARARVRKTMPVAAFGPPGTSGEENISIIVAPIFPGFDLASLGAPKEQAQWFLSNVAPDYSNRKAYLVDARTRESSDNQLYYEMEYVISSPTFIRHNLAVYTTRDDLLYTFSAQCPEAYWGRDSDKLRQAAESFRLMSRA